MNGRPRVIIIGAGFGGLYAAQQFSHQPVDVLLIDRQNFHTFTPLLYQVATCGLDPSEIAYPVRSIFYDKPNISFLLGEVTDIDFTHQHVAVMTNGATQNEAYDYLIAAGGSTTNYFGNEDMAQFAFGLKELREAIVLRNHVLKLFERAAWTDDEAARTALTTMVVVGGGPTGLETAGALYELYNHVLRKEYRYAHDLQAQVILVEASDRLLAPFPEKLQRAALEQLKSLGVEVIFDNPVAKIDSNSLHLKDGRMIATHTVIWAAGVKASPLAEMLDVSLERGGRVRVKATLEAQGRENIYVIGDMAYLENAAGQPYPQLIPVAKQQGMLAAKNIVNRVQGLAEEPFVYHDRGIMATIGRSRAVAWIYNRIPLTGFVAWVMWLVLHLVLLLGFRNRLSVLMGWVWNYLTYDRSVRIILNPVDQREAIRNPLDT